MSYLVRHRRKIRGKYRPFKPGADPVKYLRRLNNNDLPLILSGRYNGDSYYAYFHAEQEVKAICAEQKRNPHKYL